MSLGCHLLPGQTYVPFTPLNRSRPETFDRQRNGPAATSRMASGCGWGGGPPETATPAQNGRLATTKCSRSFDWLVVTDSVRLLRAGKPSKATSSPVAGHV